MQEYVTKAVVLDKQTRNDADARYYFFTERFGKIAARAKSTRKIVSKLAGHLEPGTVVAVRIIEQHGAQVVDALKIARVGIPLADLMSLNALLGEWEPDAELWRELAGRAGASQAAGAAQFSWLNTLAILGWDPRGALCTSCGRDEAPHFHLRRQEFFCRPCASRFGRNELLLINNE